MITAYKVIPQATSHGLYFLLQYCQDGSWHTCPDTFRDKSQAVRYGKSFVKSQSFNLTTTGGI